MALTEAEKLNVARILKVDYITVNDQIFNLGTAYITSAVEDRVREILTAWDTAGSDYTKIHPTERNFGAEIDPNGLKSDYRLELANLLYLTDVAASFGSGGSRLTRC